MCNDIIDVYREDATKSILRGKNAEVLKIKVDGRLNQTVRCRHSTHNGDDAPQNWMAVNVNSYLRDFFFNKTNRHTNSLKFIFVKKLYVFRAVPLPIVRSSPLYIRHWYMSCKFDDSFQARSGWN